ncbi:MAG TPA: sugar phosphate isomerase/epimerase family protein [Thermomicrobiales bacterium]|nr:sugar phosphate isomerase/epimerase family protein [Thermomicrobiales bacterium]
MGVKVALSSYSFYGFDSDDPRALPTVHEMIDRCVEFGVDGIEFMNEHLTRSGVTTAQDRFELKQYMSIKGIRPVTVAASNNPLKLTPVERADDLTQLMAHIDWAAELGAPFVRALGGRWGTITDFQELTKNRGEEPPVEGFTEDQGFEWIVGSLRAAANYAASKGVTLVLENHWGPTGTAAGCKRIHDGVDSPWLKYVLDTGNFFHLPDQYAEMQVFMSDLGMLHTKTYKGGSRVGATDPDYGRIARMLDEAGYTGYVSIEFEGKAPTREGIEDGIATIRQHLVS